MEDVAREAGVSVITVSRALNAPDKLAPATLRAVRTAIERLRYVPNLTAGSLASNRSRTVAVIVPTVNSSIFSDTIDGLAQALAPHRYQLLLGQTNYRPEEERALVAGLPRTARRRTGADRREPRARRAQQHPARRHPGRGDLGPERAARSTCWSGFSNHAAGFAAARYLLGKGHSALGYIGGTDDRSAARLQGFREAAREAGGAEVASAELPAPSSPGRCRRGVGAR